MDRNKFSYMPILIRNLGIIIELDKDNPKDHIPNIYYYVYTMVITINI